MIRMLWRYWCAFGNRRNNKAKWIVKFSLFRIDFSNSTWIKPSKIRLLDNRNGSQKLRRHFSRMLLKKHTLIPMGIQERLLLLLLNDSTTNTALPLYQKLLLLSSGTVISLYKNGVRKPVPVRTGPAEGFTGDIWAVKKRSVFSTPHEWWIGKVHPACRFTFSFL